MTTPKPKYPYPWFGYLIRVVVISLALPLCTWGGFLLWGFFSSQQPTDSPTSSGTRVFLEEKTKTDDPDENALLEGVEENNRIEYPDSIRMKILECESIESTIAEIEYLIKRSDEGSRLIEARFDVMRSLGVEIENHPDYPEVERERKFRETAASEIDMRLLELMLLEDRYPQIQMRHTENRASSSHFEESVSLLSPDEIAYLIKGSYKYKINNKSTRYDCEAYTSIVGYGQAPQEFRGLLLVVRLLLTVRCVQFRKSADFFWKRRRGTRVICDGRAKATVNRSTFSGTELSTYNR